METVKDLLNFYNHVLVYDHENIGVAEEVNQVQK